MEMNKVKNKIYSQEVLESFFTAAGHYIPHTFIVEEENVFH
jgi:hypothetical protein